KPRCRNPGQDSVLWVGRRAPYRAERTDRQGRVGHESRREQGRVLHHRRAAGDQRQDHYRSLGRRVRYPMFYRCVLLRRRQALVAAVHDTGPWRAWPRDMVDARFVEGWWRTHLAEWILRSRPRLVVLGSWESRP